MIQGLNATTELPGADRRIAWILSRALTRENTFEIAENIPESKRKSALALLVRKWSPFGSCQFAAHWVGHRVTVYAWDETRVSEAIAAAGLAPSRVTVWPETFFRAPVADGVRLATMTDGFEGQVWRGGLLAATRWWPALPAAREWITFLRASGVDVSQSPPAAPVPVVSDILPTSWTVANAPITDLWGLVQNEQVAAIAAAIVAAPFLYFLAEAAVLSVGTLRAENALAGMNASSQAIRAERTNAIGNLESIESYLSLERLPPQFELFSAAGNLLRDSKATLSDWNYDSGQLEVVLQADHPLEAATFIQMFEQDSHFSEVTGTVGNQERELRLKMRVDPQGWSA